MGVLAANHLARATVGDPSRMPAGRLNLAGHVFLDAAARELYRRWGDVACRNVGFLRLPPDAVPVTRGWPGSSPA